MKRTIRTLILTPDVPFPAFSGGQVRACSIISALCRQGPVHITCIGKQVSAEAAEAASRQGCTIANFNRKPRTRLGLPVDRLSMILSGHNLMFRPREQEFFDHQLSIFKPDVVWLETPYLIRHALRLSGRCPVIADYWGTAQGAQRDWEHARGFRSISRYIRWKLARNGERRFASQLSAVVTISRADAEFFSESYGLKDIYPIPCAPLPDDSIGSISAVQPPQEDPDLLIMTGDMSFGPNADAARYFVDIIFPRIRKEHTTAKVQFAGRSPGENVMALASVSGVKVSGYHAHLKEAIAMAAVYILPMRLGSGIRTKLLEVFALGKPIVSTSIGAEGLDLIHESNCLIADSPNEIASSCVRLLRDPALRQRLGNAVRRLATEVYTQGNVDRLVGALLRKTCKRENTPGGDLDD